MTGCGPATAYIGSITAPNRCHFPDKVERVFPLEITIHRRTRIAVDVRIGILSTRAGRAERFRAVRIISPPARIPAGRFPLFRRPLFPQPGSQPGLNSGNGPLQFLWAVPDLELPFRSQANIPALSTKTPDQLITGHHPPLFSSGRNHPISDRFSIAQGRCSKYFWEKGNFLAPAGRRVRNFVFHPVG